MGARAKAGPGQFIDVGYADLITDPSAVIQRILAAAGLEPDNPWLNSLPTGRKKYRTKTVSATSIPVAIRARCGQRSTGVLPTTSNIRIRILMGKFYLWNR